MINKILILVISILLINYLTEGKIIETIYRYLTTCKDKFESFVNIKRTSMSNNISENDSYQLYRYVNNMVTPYVNVYELTSDRTHKLAAPISLVNELIDHISKIFNSSGYKFDNITILDKIYWYENARGKDIDAFNFSADIKYRGKSIGTWIFNIECFLREDKFFDKPLSSRFLTIINIRQTNGTGKQIISAYKLDQSNLVKTPDVVFNKQPKHVETAIKTAVEMTEKMNESFNGHFVSIDNDDKLFIKPTNTTNQNANRFVNDTENSLIPSIIDFDN
jgi:hypothetical protein